MGELVLFLSLHYLVCPHPVSITVSSIVTSLGLHGKIMSLS